MTSEKNLTKEFFRVFGIEPFCDLPCNKRGVECTDNTYCGNKYPEITAEKLLEMICICNSTYINGYTNYFMTTGKTKEVLKEEILKKCITLSKDIKNQIQQLFKQGGRMNHIGSKFDDFLEEENIEISEEEIREKIKHKKAKKQAIIREILDLKAIGLNNKQIAEELGCHRCTISRYINGVLGHRMSEIEKMYENAGVEDKNINNQLYKDLNYPQFNAEKQLKLIKWLGKKNYTISIDFHENEWGIATEDYSGYFQDNLSDALASIINNL